MESKETRFESLTHAFKNGKIVTIEEVESGLNCECNCPACNGKLIARKGKKKVHHFAHYNGEDCNNWHETELHLKAKEILSKSEYMVVPEYRFNGLRRPSRKVKIYSAELEKWQQGIIPDIILETDDGRIYVEIKVTHGIDDYKQQKIERIGESVIEITIPTALKLEKESADLEMSVDEYFKYILLESERKKSWKFHSKKKKYEEIIEKLTIPMKIIGSYSKYCLKSEEEKNGNCRECRYGVYEIKDEFGDDYVLCRYFYKNIINKFDYHYVNGYEDREKLLKKTYDKFIEKLNKYRKEEQKNAEEQRRQDRLKAEEIQRLKERTKNYTKGLDEIQRNMYQFLCEKTKEMRNRKTKMDPEEVIVHISDDDTSFMSWFEYRDRPYVMVQRDGFLGIERFDNIDTIQAVAEKIKYTSQITTENLEDIKPYVLISKPMVWFK